MCYRSHDFCVILEGQIPVCASRGHIHHPAVFCTELDPEPFQVRRGFTPQIDEHVEHRSARTAHELYFLVRGRLIMQATQRASTPAERGVALHECRAKTMLGELPRTPQPCERSPFVLAWFRVDNPGALY